MKLGQSGFLFMVFIVFTEHFTETPIKQDVKFIYFVLPDHNVTLCGRQSQ